MNATSPRIPCQSIPHWCSLRYPEKVILQFWITKNLVVQMLARKWLVLSVRRTGLRVLEKEGRGENLQILCSHRLNPNPIYTTRHVLHVWGEHLLLLCVARARQSRSQILKQHWNSFFAAASNEVHDNHRCEKAAQRHRCLPPPRQRKARRASPGPSAPPCFHTGNVHGAAWLCLSPPGGPIC